MDKNREKYSSTSIYCGFEKHPRVTTTTSVTTSPSIPQKPTTKDAATSTTPIIKFSRRTQTTLSAIPEKKKVGDTSTSKSPEKKDSGDPSTSKPVTREKRKQLKSEVCVYDKKKGRFVPTKNNLNLSNLESSFCLPKIAFK